MKAVVDRDVCISCELCTQICPEVFRMEDDKAIAYVDVVPAEVEDTCREAADSCPVSCISVEAQQAHKSDLKLKLISLFFHFY